MKTYVAEDALHSQQRARRRADDLNRHRRPCLADLRPLVVAAALDPPPVRGELRRVPLNLLVVLVVLLLVLRRLRKP